MAEENNDANTDTEDVTGADSSSDTGEFEPIIGDDGLISTLEYQRVEKEADTKEDDTSDDAEQNTSEDHADKQDFHEHPRFKELVEEKNELKRRLDELSSKSEESKTEDKAEDQPSFKNIMGMDDDTIAEEMAESPKAFLVNFAQQIAHELRMDRKAEEKAKQAQAATMSVKEKAEQNKAEFFKDKEDGQAMLKDGRIAAYVKENPAHNEISAYHALAGESAVKAKIEAAVKEAENRIYKELKAKGRSASTATSTGSGVLDSDKSPEMKNPDKFGGRESVLLKRLLARQAS